MYSLINRILEGARRRHRLFGRRMLLWLLSWEKFDDPWPREGDIHLRIGRISEELQDWETARRHYRACERYSHVQHDAVAGIGRIEFQAERYEEAARHFERALSYQKDWTTAGWLASAYLCNGDFPSAIEVLGEYLPRSKGDIHMIGLMIECEKHAEKCDNCAMLIKEREEKQRAVVHTKPMP